MRPPRRSVTTSAPMLRAWCPAPSSRAERREPGQRKLTHWEWLGPGRITPRSGRLRCQTDTIIGSKVQHRLQPFPAEEFAAKTPEICLSSRILATISRECLSIDNMFYLSIICIVTGVVTTHSATRYPRFLALIECIGGILMIFGLGLIGFCLPMYR